MDFKTGRYMWHSGCDGPKWLWVIWAIILSLQALPTCAEEVLLSAQQPFCMGNNTTLVIEDIDPLQSVAWLKIYCGNRTVDSAVIGLGGHLGYRGCNLTMQKIYSGGEDDLVAFDIENETIGSAAISGNASISNTTLSSCVSAAPPAKAFP